MSVEAILVRQAGVISRDQAVAAGLSRDAVDRRVRLRHWHPLHPRVYLAGGHRLDDEVRVRAALLWAGEGAVLSGTAAAWWHGMHDRAPVVIGVTVSRRRHPRPRPGVSVRRRELAGEDLVRCRGLDVTGPPLTVLEAAVELGAGGGVLLDGALRRWVRFPQVYEAYCRNLGSHGSAGAGRMLAAAADRSAAAAQLLLARLLRGSGAAGWHSRYPTGGGVIDFAFPAARVAVEVEGWAWRPDLARARTDERRRRALGARGWTILRYTWPELVGEPRAVLAEIADAVGRGMAAAG